MQKSRYTAKYRGLCAFVALFCCLVTVACTGAPPTPAATAIVAVASPLPVATEPPAPTVTQTVAALPTATIRPNPTETIVVAAAQIVPEPTEAASNQAHLPIVQSGGDDAYPVEEVVVSAETIATPIPPTPLPPTQAPTLAPATAIPTAIPPTPIPPTPVPPTLVPPTLVPPTAVPPTPLPPTALPPTLPPPTEPPPPTAAPTIAPTPLPPATAVPQSSGPVDFASLRTALNAEGKWLVNNKIGFHVGIGGNMNGLGDWMRALDAARVPIFLKSVGNAGPIFEAQQLMQASGVPHTLVFRQASNSLDVPIYDLSPYDAAQAHWADHIAIWPPELNKNLVWLETINEVDKNRSEWLAEFSYETALLALRDGYKWSAFGWSSGEPEPNHWEGPAMLKFLRLVAEHPNQLSIALHEYSFTTSDMAAAYPHLIGRFQTLFAVCDRNDIPRPTVLITEWGWQSTHVPKVDRAIEDIDFAARLYAPYPQIKGAAIWYLGTGFDGIDDDTQKLIKPITDYSLENYFVYP